MAVSVVSFTQTAWTNTTTPKTVTGQAWSSGDVIVVMGGLENAGAVLNTPTNANLTFSLQASVTTGGSNEVAAYVWTATAGSAQTAQTISGSRGNPGQHWGFGCWVLTGTSGSVANASANQTESGFTFTPTAGSAVCYFFGDWNADTGNQTLATGTGTGTERADANGTQWSWYAGEWVGVTATSTTFGVTSYTGLQVGHAVIEVLASGGGATSANAGNAAGTGSAPQPVSLVAPNAAVSSGTGSAPAPTAALLVNVGLAAATGTAGQATVTTSGAATNAPAGLAAATGAANAPAAAVAANAGVASGTGAANQPNIALRVNAGFAAAAGTAPQPTVQTGAFANTPAGLAAATGTANGPTIAIRANVGVAAGTGAANQPTGLLGARAGAAASTGNANGTTVAVGAIALPGVASGTGAANTPTVTLGAYAGLALVTATAPAAVGRGNLPVERISDPLTLAAAGQDSPLTAIVAPLTLEALED